MADPLASGSVADRPWGQTLAALGQRGLTGQLTVVADERRYCIAFDLGGVVGATSPLASDAVARIALQSQLIPSSRVVELTRQIAASPDRDEVDIVVDAVSLDPEQARRLRRRVVAQRAARTFSVDQGAFAVEQRIAMPIQPGNETDLRAVIYLGARMNLSEQRLASELRQFGERFTLKPEAIATLAQYGFTDDERPILDALALGTSLPELEAKYRDIDPRTTQAMLYALACCDACEIERAAVRIQAATIDEPMQLPRTRTEPVGGAEYAYARTKTADAARVPPSSRTATRTGPVPLVAPASPASTARTTTAPGVAPDPRSASAHTAGLPTAATRTPTRTGPPATVRPATLPPAGARPITQSPPLAPRTATGNAGSAVPTSAGPAVARTATGGAPAVARTGTGTGPNVGRTSTARRVQALIATRMILVEQGADYFELLGVAFDAPIDAVRTAYFLLAKQLHPDKLAELDVTDDAGAARRLFAEVSNAFAVLTDPERRAAYLARVRGAEPTAARVKTDDAATDTTAAGAYKRGEVALRRDDPMQAVLELRRACELEPMNVDYEALLAWAQFCAANDRQAIAVATRKSLDKAVFRSDKPLHARFLLGRVERMLGRDREALRHFHEVLEEQPNHAEAASEVRAIEARNRR